METISLGLQNSLRLGEKVNTLLNIEPYALDLGHKTIQCYFTSQSY